ncbi:NAD(P)H-dependent oxidoreductase [Campylobacter sp. MIT 99-7217]|uniref:NAD(P)H-dependent oxidoreductase n=1 Tax=Campylobacter sp. MIT 99-7217 TaxID=535091 RepID=UPI00115B2C4B|nr:NAD(P)H-dependent oxidoreductase [Campylobacter sp. MIT 99-7217]TQR34692.1 NAD(P)H-dependent oxidoreductase [Campylobacter sp. MIT 99-7217]
MDKEKILEIFNRRYACKLFDEKKAISDDDFRVILEAGRLSPSSFGFEPWEFVVLENKSDSQKALRKKLHPFCWGGQKALEGASHYLIILARKRADLLINSAYLRDMMVDVQKLPAEVVQIKSKFFSDFQEQFDLHENDRALFDWACKQAYIALGNMMSVATALGADSCAIEGFDMKAVNELLAKESVFDPAHFGVAVMCGFGYKGEDKYAGATKSRRKFEEVIRFIP